MLLVSAGVAHATLQDPPASTDGVIRREEFTVGGDAPLPEAVRKHFGLPPGATVKDLPVQTLRRLPSAKRYFRALESLATETAADVPATIDAIIAWERLGLTPEAWQLDAPIKLGKPLRGEVPAGTILVREIRDAGGQELYCIEREPGKAFEPFVDERRTIYPSLCLFDSDKDGSPDSIKAEPYRPENPVISQTIGRPVAWTPLSARSTDPRSLGFVLTRQLRVKSIDARHVTLASRLHSLPRGMTTPMVSDSRQTVELPLRDGERVTMDGITVTVAQVDGAWYLRASGRFVPWAALSPDRLGYRILPSEASEPE
ncbi:hypothetical protein [Sphingomonas sp. LT1P40]|uniref:hypothetical protein n=1 Tax=Alteristakelama amylovorans TaxID=3096166 RepID=UPI002FCC6718